MKDVVYTLLLVTIIITGHVLGNLGQPDVALSDVSKNTVDTLAAPTATVTVPVLSVFPEHIEQGEPFMIVFNGVEATSSIKQVTFNGVRILSFKEGRRIAAFAGIDLNHSAGKYEVRAELNDGTILTHMVTIASRPKVEAPIGIPEKLGGNTAASQQKLVSTLADEALVLRTLKSSPERYWSGTFEYPLKNPVITDDYGYSRQTGAYIIAHKGTDFRASEGTPMYAMNRGEVRLVREFRNYGKTVVIDHGGGLMTLYLHLSEFSVREGQMVEKGQEIGKSGSTGYANGAHLHLSVKINSISIDPVKFIELLYNNE